MALPTPRRVIVANDGTLYVQKLAGSPGSKGFVMPNIEEIELLSWDFFRDVYTYVQEEGKGCPCKLTGALMAALGAPFSAQVHLEPGRTWTEPELFVHFEEEDTTIVPLQRALGLTSDADEIEKDHARFRRQRERGIPLDMREIGEHARREDQMTERLLKAMSERVAKVLDPFEG